MELPVQLIQNREPTLTGVFRYANTRETAIELVRTGRVDLDGMVTARYPDRMPGNIKSVVEVGAP